MTTPTKPQQPAFQFTPLKAAEQVAPAVPGKAEDNKEGTFVL